ncbi:hypothetical protein [Photobacterium damselae]|uniref:hypothetical protein n=1 Tax=Photobacterium damselae TaxID=38293 RepID=UPI00083B8474|nr:hypothetical protein [Photobacterium damselae]ODA24572.1 hypothetical protein A0J46_16160 [Photobacterium damselae subsp. damselae]
MAEEKGFIQCACGERATVWEWGGQKAGKFFTRCPKCGMNQCAGLDRQQEINKEMVLTISEYEDKYNENQSSQGFEPIETTIEVDRNLSDSEALPKTVFEATTEPEETKQTGILAMCVGLAVASGLFVGYRLGVR